MTILIVMTISIICIALHEQISTYVGLNMIVNRYGKITSNCEIISKDEAAIYINLSNTNKNKLKNSAEDKDFIKINLKSSKRQHVNPNEILSIMDSYLFFKEKDIIENISGFICCYQSGSVSDLNSVDVVVSMVELNELYDECKSYSGNLNAQGMAVKWIEKNYYFRDGLEMNMQYSGLVSEWNEYITSTDGNFQLGYIYDDNRLKVLNLEYNKHENIDIVTSKTMWNTKVDESGKVYAVWDEENNIWMLGEKTGIKLFQFNGKDSWSIATEYNEDSIPDVFNSITFTK